jgi:Fe-S-cluster containining protein
MSDHQNHAPVDPPSRDTGEFSFTLRAGSESLQFKFADPPGPIPLADAVLVLLNIAEALTQAAQREGEAAGRTISCGPKCGACCRQLVPVSGLERLHLQALVAALPATERDEVHRRFREAQTRLAQSGQLAELRTIAEVSREERQRIGLRYFALQLPCPFLVDESCSIHPARPMACREYLVSSPPQFCATPTAENVHPLPMPVKPSHAAMKLTKDLRLDQPEWLPMIEAIDPELPPNDDGTLVNLRDIVHRFLLSLAPGPHSSNGPAAPGRSANV